MPRPSIATIFPAVPKTVWGPGDADLDWLGDGGAGSLVRGPHIDLDTGLYGVEFQLSLTDQEVADTTPVAEVQVTAFGVDQTLAEATILAGQLKQDFAGMYQGVRPDLFLEKPAPDVEFRVNSLGTASFSLRAIKLIPRPGQTWFPADLEIRSEDWELTANRSARTLAPTQMGGPGIHLPEGEYRLGFKLKAPAELPPGELVALDVVGIPVDRPQGSAQETIAERTVFTAEQLRAHGGVPDAKLRFHLAQPYREVEFRLEAFAAGLIVQWVRLATAEEATWHHYYHLGGSASPLGHPLTAFLPAGPSPSGRPGYRRDFEHGAMYYTAEAGPCELFEAVLAKYLELGGPRGDLGFPTGRPRPGTSPGEMQQSFEGGELQWIDSAPVEVTLPEAEA